IRITDDPRLPRFRNGARRGNHALRNETCPGVLEFPGQFVKVVNIQGRSPEDQVIGLAVQRRGLSTRRRDVFEKLNARAMLRTQSSNPQSRPKDLVEVLLLYTVILAFAHYP